MTPKATPPADNGKVTLGILGEKVDNQTKKLDDFIIEVRPLIAVLAVHTQRLDDLEEDISDLETSDKRWNLGLIIGTIISGILGAIGISK
jgi:hypothetical protein